MGSRLPSLDDMTAQRIALVTGANQGIGYALVEGLAARWRLGDLVLLTGRNQSRVTEAAARATGSPATVARVEARQLDVTDADSVARMAAGLTEQYGGVDGAGANATARITPGPVPGGAGRRVHRRGERRYARDAALVRADCPPGRAPDRRGQCPWHPGQPGSAPAPAIRERLAR